MARNISVFLDSDVVISSLLSNKGAAFLLITQAPVTKNISNYSLEEMTLVIKKLGIPENKLTALSKDWRIVKLNQAKTQLARDFAKYVTDPDDVHIIAGAQLSGARFLLTYNQKHYVVNLIKNDLGVNVLTPALFLQYLRSL